MAVWVALVKVVQGCSGTGLLGSGHYTRQQINRAMAAWLELFWPVKKIIIGRILLI